MLEVIVGEVYSPSHFWYLRLGQRYNLAMEDMMDDMARYYNGEGRERRLARGAVRVGHYCAALYDNDWHRALIVKILDSDTVKVRHVDYGTVDAVGWASLRPLRREWARLAAQAGRARLAGVRPSAAGRRWPRAAAAHFLDLVRARPLVANIVAVDHEEGVIETLLLDTSGAEDRCLSGELVRAGHADARGDCALLAADCYLFPRFEALESGATPNYAEIHAYLRDGIALDYVAAYAEHVPAWPPADVPARGAPPPPSPPPPPPPPPSRIPLLLPAADPPVEDRGSPVPPPDSPLSPSATPNSTISRSASNPRPSNSPCPISTEMSPTPPVSQQQTPRPEPACDQSSLPTTQWTRSETHLPGPPPPLPNQFGMVTLSPAECSTYSVLASVDPAAAHWYMASKLDQARRPPNYPGPPTYVPPRGPQCSWGPPGIRAPPGYFGPPSLPNPLVHMGPPSVQSPVGLFCPPGFSGPPVQFVPPRYYVPSSPFGPPSGFSS
ncbi:uncharacterized protein LOC113505260 [Trichoplusia ni]|uniref:Uncharacterized protein LOC113505260 n=1 Tax=Trichoplusia ni TaxID=7111 RepID=A0A7E5WSW6_TRINI|nr:uncharacterized protein LOC113505260 [Trichoplusia ni]